MTRAGDEGFTLVETLVAIALLSILSVGFYQVMYSAVRGSGDAADVAEVAEEARLGFNRMIRDTRETTQLVVAEGDRYRIWVDYNRNKLVDAAEFEYLEYAYDGSRITLTALAAPPAGNPDLLSGGEDPLTGIETETLAANVNLLEEEGVELPIFTYVSNFLAFDTIDQDGEATVDEIEAGTVGADNNRLEGVELRYVSDVNYGFEVSVNGNSRAFYGQAQIRNRRYSDL